MFSYFIEPDDRLMVTTITGVITFADLVAYRERSTSDERISLVTRHLIDATRVTGDELSWEQVRQLANARVRSFDADPRSAGYRLAIVTGRLVDFGRARTFEALADGVGQVQVFTSLAAAAAWLGLERTPGRSSA